MRESVRKGALFCVFTMLAAGCMPARGAGDYKMVRAYNKVTGEYFDVKVPYNTRYGHRGWPPVTKSEPDRDQVEKAVDNATSAPPVGAGPLRVTVPVVGLVRPARVSSSDESSRCVR